MSVEDEMADNTEDTEKSTVGASENEMRELMRILKEMPLDDGTDDDNSVDFNAGAPEDDIRELTRQLPVQLPEAWLAVLRVSNGFETLYPLASPPFYVMSTHDLSASFLQPEEWNQRFHTAMESVFPVAIDFESGFYGLDLSTQTPSGECAVVRISPYSDSEEFRHDTIRELLENSLNEADWERFNPHLPAPAQQLIVTGKELADAAERGHLNQVKALLGSGADINAQNEYGTPLMNATMGEHAAVVRYLLEQGAEVNAQVGGGSALIEASRTGSLDTVRMLLDRGADLDVCSPNGTALGWALDARHPDIALILIEHGANPNLGDMRGRTPLIIAVQGNEPQVVAALIAHGADVNAPFAGRTPLQWARENRREQGITLLQQAGALEE